MKTTLTVVVDYDPASTDPDGLARAADRLLLLSPLDALSDYGNPTFGPFYVADISASPGIVMCISGGVLCDVFSTQPLARAILVDWDTDGCEKNDDGMVETNDGFAYVVNYPVCPMSQLNGTAADEAIYKGRCAGVLPPQDGPPVYTLRLDGSLLRQQREFLVQLRHNPERTAIDNSALDGLISLTDALADQAHDNYGLDCLLTETHDGE